MDNLPRFITPIMRVVGNFCNLRCQYCFYRGDDQATPHLMGLDVLHKAIQDITSYNIQQGNRLVEFIWHGGEPLLAGIQFFETVVRIQNDLQLSKAVSFVNSIQTNGTLINQEWASFFARNRFQVGVSLDGLPHLHNRYRIDVRGEGSWDLSLRGYRILKEFGINPGIIVVVHAETIPFAKEIVRYLYNEVKVGSIAFSPFIDPDSTLGLLPLDYQKFLKEVLDVWMEIDSQDLQIREIDDFLNLSQGIQPSGCVFNGSCASYLSVQPNGDVYPCSRLQFKPDLLFGNLLNQGLSKILKSEGYLRFKRFVSSLPDSCRRCELSKSCNNGCTAYRFNGKYYFCETRRKFSKIVRREIGDLLKVILEVEHEK